MVLMAWLTFGSNAFSIKPLHLQYPEICNNVNVDSGNIQIAQSDCCIQVVVKRYKQYHSCFVGNIENCKTQEKKYWKKTT